MDNNNSESAQPNAKSISVRRVRCPGCGGDSLYAETNHSRPFCSIRCKSMDFGAWASEGFRVAAPAIAEELVLDRDTLQ